VAQAHLQIGGTKVEVFGPRAEQVAHLLELQDGRTAQKLGERLGDHVADDDKESGALDLDADEQFELLTVVEQLISAAHEPPPEDVRELYAALRGSLGAVG
jgi:hypothetical protein